MKLVSQFKNKYNNITYKRYVSKDGVPVIHLKNPATVDFNLYVAIKAGASYEDQVGVPHGTAHFLEHMLFEPNSFFNSDEEIDKYEQGNRSRAAIHANGYTSRKYMYFDIQSNENSTLRSLKRLSMLIDFPKEKFKETVEKERAIILAERAIDKKKEKLSGLKLMEYLTGEKLPEFAYHVLGEEEDIKKITIDDLEKFFHARFSKKNIIISIQSKDNFSNNVKNSIEKIIERFQDFDVQPFKDVKLENHLDIETFEDSEATGITMALIFLKEKNERINYEEDALRAFCFRLIGKVGFDILRQKKGLVYDIDIDGPENLFPQNLIYSLKLTTEKKNFNKLIDATYDLLYKDVFDFLESKRGKSWFLSVLSTFIYPRTTKFFYDLPLDIALGYIESRDIFNSNIYVKNLKKVTIPKIETYLRKQLEIPPHFWVEGDIKKDYIEKIVKQSKLYKKFS